MVLVAKVNKREISKVKDKLIDNNNLNNEYRITTDDKYGYIPLNNDKVKNKLIIEIINKRLKKFEKKYDYKTKLKKLLGDKEFSSFDVIGDICIIRIDKDIEKYEKQIANILLEIPNVKTVLKRESKYDGEFRTQKLKYLSGLKKKETTHLESGVRLKLDVEKVYFSIRSSTERLRIANLVKKGEKVLVMFSGCSPYELVIGKHSEANMIIGIEKNPIAHKYALENVNLNKMNAKSERIKVIEGDVRKIDLNDKFDRIIMPLPKSAYEFLDVAKKYSKKGTIIHLYHFSEWTNKKELNKEYKLLVSKYIHNFKIKEIVKAGNYSPNVYRVCVEIEIN